MSCLMNVKFNGMNWSENENEKHTIHRTRTVRNPMANKRHVQRTGFSGAVTTNSPNDHVLHHYVDDAIKTLNFIRVNVNSGTCFFCVFATINLFKHFVKY